MANEPLRTQILQKQIDDTIAVMHKNIDEGFQRGERLDSLEDKTNSLRVSVQGFRRGANKARKRMWLKDMRMRICLCLGIVLILSMVIIVSIVVIKR